MFSTYIYNPNLICIVLQTPPRRTIGQLVRNNPFLKITTREITFLYSPKVKPHLALSTTLLYETELSSWTRAGTKQQAGRYHQFQTGHDDFYQTFSLLTTVSDQTTSPRDIQAHADTLEELINEHPTLKVLLTDAVYIIEMPERFAYGSARYTRSTIPPPSSVHSYI